MSALPILMLLGGERVVEVNAAGATPETLELVLVVPFCVVVVAPLFVTADPAADVVSTPCSVPPPETGA
jgi:hypothetical protein